MSYDQYSRVWASIWLEPWSEDARMLAFYLLTGPHRRSEGIYRLPLAYATADLKWTPKRTRAALDELEPAFVMYDTEAEVVLIVNALKRHGFNGKQIVGITKALAALPRTPLLKRFASLAQTHNESLAKALAEANGTLAHATTNNYQLQGLRTKPLPSSVLLAGSATVVRADGGSRDQSNGGKLA